MAKVEKESEHQIHPVKDTALRTRGGTQLSIVLESDDPKSHDCKTDRETKAVRNEVSHGLTVKTIATPACLSVPAMQSAKFSQLFKSTWYHQILSSLYLFIFLSRFQTRAFNPFSPLSATFPLPKFCFEARFLCSLVCEIYQPDFCNARLSFHPSLTRDSRFRRNTEFFVIYPLSACAMRCDSVGCSGLNRNTHDVCQSRDLIT